MQGMVFPCTDVKSRVAYYASWSPVLHVQDAEQVVAKQMQGDRAWLAGL